MSDFSDDEYAMAIAAAAHAFTTMELSPNQKGASKGPESSVTTVNNKRDDNTIKTANSSSYFQKYRLDEAENRNSAVPYDNFVKNTTDTEKHMLEDSTAQQKNAEKAIHPLPTIGKAVTFTDRHLNDIDVSRFEIGQKSRTGVENVSTMKLTTSLPGENSRGMNSAEADAWEKEQIAKIRDRYEKRRAAILEWENEKKTKAKYQIQQHEKGLEQRQVKAMQEYQAEIAWLEKLTSRTKTLTEDQKISDESKVRERAQLMRSRRKVPRTCFCF